MSAGAATEVPIGNRAPGDVQLERRQSLVPRGTRLVIYSLLALLIVRFFSEGIGILPRSSTFIDIPIFVLLVGVAAARGRSLVPSRTYFVPGLLCLGIAAVAALANPSRVAPAPVLVFLYGFLAPLGIYYAVYRLWPPGNAAVLTRLLVVVGLVEFVAVGKQLPEFLRTGNADLISGTFGENAYQLVFFLLVLTAVLAGMAVFERGRAAARFAPLMFFGIAATIFLAQYRALLITTLITVVVIAFFLTKAKPAKGIVIGAFAVVAFVGSFNYIAHKFPALKLREALSSIQSNPWFFVSTRLHAMDDALSLYTDHPRFILTGTGPGTFSSRAWKTFANVRESHTAVTSPYARALNGGGSYETDVADKYTVPRLRTARFVQGSKALTSPLSSYTSLLAEVGLPGFLAYLSLYLLALGHSIVLLLRAMRRATPGDPLPALLLGSTVAFMLLLQLAALENWLEVTRITFLSWALLAAATRESDARQRVTEIRSADPL